MPTFAAGKLQWGAMGDPQLTPKMGGDVQIQI